MSWGEMIPVGAVLAAAVAYLFRRMRRFFGPDSAGGCCGKCPAVRPRAPR
jgi:hypothetical protein